MKFKDRYPLKSQHINLAYVQTRSISFCVKQPEGMAAETVCQRLRYNIEGFKF